MVRRRRKRQDRDAKPYEHGDECIFTGNIAEETKRQRERLGQLTYNVKRKQKRHHAPTDHVSWAAGHVVEIAKCA